MDSRALENCLAIILLCTVLIGGDSIPSGWKDRGGHRTNDRTQGHRKDRSQDRE